MASPKICFFDDEAARRNRRQEMLPAGYARLSFDEDGQTFAASKIKWISSTNTARTG